MTTHTQQIVAGMSNAEIAAVYNSIADRPVKKFRDAPTARRRLINLLGEHSLALQVEKKTGRIVPCSVEEERTIERRGRRGRLQPHWRIRLIQKENPKRGRSAERYALYTDGMTVQDYRDACAELGQHPDKPGWWYTKDLHWDADRGYISVEEVR